MNRYQYFGYDEVHERVRLQMRLMDVMKIGGGGGTYFACVL